MLKDFLVKKPEFDGASIIVTGGTGSFGQAFIKKVSQLYRPKKLIVFSRDELKQYEMAQKFPEAQYPFLRFFIGDVRDYNRLEMAFRDIDVVVHAAALKHVPIAEYNPYECIHTNVIGAENIVRAAFRQKVKKVIALSTDKAVSPINLYGASKLAADKIFVAANNIQGNDPTTFSVVRYGNVIGSRGSIVPMFQKMAQTNVPFLPITDDRMTRFWIALEQGVDFVLSSIELMKGGEIFVPKIPSMKIIDMAKVIAPGIDTKIIGIRPGEKLHEAMLTADESNSTYNLEDRFVLCPGNLESAKHYDKTCSKVAERFIYSSDQNDEWLKPEELNMMIRETSDSVSSKVA